MTTTAQATQLKRVLGVYPNGSQHWVGDGFPVRNLFPSNGVSDEINPFLMLDYMGPAHFAPSEHPRGVGEHPHRGFETVTIVYQGTLAHRDSAGNAGVIGPGDVQWMTAASGIVHEEFHEREFAKQGGIVEGVQLWVNLPKKHKTARPGYQPIVSAQIPAVDLGPGVRARVIAGELSGVKGPAHTFTPINVFDVSLDGGARVDLDLPMGHNAGLVLRSGEVTVEGTHSVKGEALLAVLSPGGTRVSIEAQRHSHLLVLSGEPIREPVVQYGPFVMNTQEEIRQAFADYKSGKMGRLS